MRRLLGDLLDLRLAVADVRDRLRRASDSRTASAERVDQVVDERLVIERAARPRPCGAGRCPRGR